MPLFPHGDKELAELVHPHDAAGAGSANEYPTDFFRDGENKV
jgi:hypothetical protein